MTDESRPVEPRTVEPRAVPRATVEPPKKRRMAKRNVRIAAWAAAVGAFLLPWTVIRSLPSQASAAGAVAGHQVVVVPPGSRVVITKPAGSTGKVVVLTSKGGAATSPTAPVATTGGSVPIV